MNGKGSPRLVLFVNLACLLSPIGLVEDVVEVVYNLCLPRPELLRAGDSAVRGGKAVRRKGGEIHDIHRIDAGFFGVSVLPNKVTVYQSCIAKSQSFCRVKVGSCEQYSREVLQTYRNVV